MQNGGNSENEYVDTETAVGKVGRIWTEFELGIDCKAQNLEENLQRHLVSRNVLDEGSRSIFSLDITEKAEEWYAQECGMEDESAARNVSKIGVSSKKPVYASRK